MTQSSELRSPLLNDVPGDAAHKDASASQPERPAPVSFYEAFRFWLKLGFISFGGPAGQIAIMHAELVEQKRWISSVCMMAIWPAGPPKLMKPSFSQKRKAS